MSLDVYLEGEPEESICRCAECDHEHKRTITPELYSANITHNLNTMAENAGIYKHLWRPDEIGISRAVELIAPLAEGLARLKAAPSHFKQWDAPNGWGLYEHFVPFVEKYLAACREHPQALVRVWR